MLRFIWSRLIGGGWAELAEIVVNPTPRYQQGSLFGEYPDLPEIRLAYQT